MTPPGRASRRVPGRNSRLPARGDGRQVARLSAGVRGARGRRGPCGTRGRLRGRTGAAAPDQRSPVDPDAVVPGRRWVRGHWVDRRAPGPRRGPCPPARQRFKDLRPVRTRGHRARRRTARPGRADPGAHRSGPRDRIISGRLAGVAAEPFGRFGRVRPGSPGNTSPGEPVFRRRTHFPADAGTDGMSRDG